jgi:hypothetical protein
MVNKPDLWKIEIASSVFVHQSVERDESRQKRAAGSVQR